MTTESALQRIAAAKAELAAAEAELAAKEKLKPWRPEGDGEYWIADYSGVDDAFTDYSQQEDTHGNIWRTKEQAKAVARLHAIINHSMAFAYAAGGDGTREAGKWCIYSGSCGARVAETISGWDHPSFVWFPTRASAQACLDFLRERGLL